jgi:hypothetical protein
MIQAIILIILSVWLAGVTGVLIYIFSVFRKFTKDLKDRDLLKMLSKVIDKEMNNSKLISENSQQIKKLFSDQNQIFHKLGVVRFNPFSEMGGDHSFSIALLDGNNDGILLTGLHTRERTRVYMKNVVKGKTKLELSKEESDALRKALVKKL